MARRDSNLELLTALSLSALLLTGCGQAVVPKEFKTYVAKDEAFKCDQPAGWTVTGGGKSGNYLASFSSGGATIKIILDVTGSVLADIAKTSNQMAGGDDAQLPSPLEQMHELSGQSMAEDLGNFKDLNTAEIQIPIGLARKSEYTGSGSLGSQQHGYRVTSLLVDQRVTVICRCPEKEWKNLQPVFDRVIKSLSR